LIDPNSPEGKAYIAKLYGSFFFFTCEVFKEMGWDKFDPPDDIFEDMCNWHQYGPNKKGTLAPRSDGKTHRIVGCGTAWDHFRDPRAVVGIVSKGAKEARKTLKLIKDLYRNVSFLKHLYPHDDDTARDNAEELDIVGRDKAQRNPSVWVAGIESQLPGRRASRVFGDDVEDKPNVKTRESRQDLLSRTREFDNIASYGERRVDYVGTYHHEESVYIALAREGYQFRTWPLVAPHPQDEIIGLSPLVKQKMANGKLKPSTERETFDGGIVRPLRYSHDYVAEKRARGLSNFAMQFMLVSSLGNSLRYPLKLRDLIVFDTTANKAPVSIAWGTNNGQGTSTVVPDIPCNGFGTDCLHAPIFFDKHWLPFTGVKMWVDPSGQGADKTGYAIVAHLGAMLYALEVGGLKDHTGSGHSPEVLHNLIAAAKEHNVTNIHVEDFGMQSTFKQLLEPIVQQHTVQPNSDPSRPDGWACSVELTRPPASQTNKEQRIIDILEPITAQHRLVVSTRVARSDTLQYQLTRITRQRGCLEHEDELEALAYASWLWQDQLNRGPEQHRQRFEEERQRRMLEKYLPKPTKMPNWIRRR